MNLCTVKNCFSEEDGRRRFFAFPPRSRTEQFQKWVEFCQDETLAYINKRVRRWICDLHFADTDLYDGNKLCAMAVPSMYGPPPLHAELVDITTAAEVMPAETIPSTPTHQFTISSTPNIVQPLTSPPSTSHILTQSTPVSLPSGIPTPSTSRIPVTSIHISKCVKRLPFSTPSTGQTLAKPSSSRVGSKHSLTLKHISMTRMWQLSTPRKRALFRFTKDRLKELNKLTEKYRELRVHVRKLCNPNISIVAALEYFSKHMTAASTLFLSSQLKSSSKKPKARRWTVEEKLLALSFYKRSSKAYALMRNVFALPSKRTLKRLVNKLPFASGINDQMFTTLSQHVEQLSKRDRTCTLIFDEISIREHLSYSCSTDRIDGFEDRGHKGRTKQIANHALVFMVRGLFRMWKQPVAYYFSHSSMKSDILAELILVILEACCKAGLYVVATVCDMGATNIKALKIMGSTKPEHPYFLYNNKPVFTILDPPHLLKCTRNLFQKYDIKCCVNTGSLNFEGQAKWDYVRRAYEWDKNATIFRQLHHLRKDHVQPLGKQKMKVRLAAQLLSHRVAACVNTAVTCQILPPSAIATAAFVKGCDDLFDSFNGCATDKKSGKTLRLPLSDNSHHMAFWQQALTFINSWKILRPGCSSFRPPSQNGWLTSINAVMQLWMSVKTEFEGVRFLSVRCLNQDALENVFGSVRANCGANNNPTVPQFVDALKTCIINGLAFRELRNGNCLDDNADLLSNLQTFLGSGIVTDKDSKCTPYAMDTGDVTCDKEADIPSDMHLMSTAYVSGFIARKLLANSACDDCRAGLCTKESGELYLTGIQFMEYTEGTDRLMYPTKNLVTCVAQCADIVDEILDEKAHLDRLTEIVICTIKLRVSFKWLMDCCSVHYTQLMSCLLKNICKTCIPWWCKRKNHYLGMYARQK